MIIKRILKALKNPEKIIPFIRNSYAPIVAKKPQDSKFTFSDLFIWRCGNNWKTTYYLFPYIGLLSKKEELLNIGACKSRLVILSNDGNFLAESKIEFEPIRKSKLNLADYIPSSISSDKYGTFMIFHENILRKEILNGGYITDRGYTSYGFGSSNTLSYVHGNLDAVSGKYSKNGIEELTYFKSTILKRSFQLQYLFTPINSYEIAITNPTRKSHKVCLNFFNNQGETFKSIEIELSTLGVRIVQLPSFESNFLISIRSNLPMARPLIFKSNNQKFVDVFHG
tara:strand:+ start:19 stop:867 length:849 start_codon:yes stop_codon:yes gene_type:complete